MGFKLRLLVTINEPSSTFMELLQTLHGILVRLGIPVGNHYFKSLDALTAVPAPVRAFLVAYCSSTGEMTNVLPMIVKFTEKAYLLKIVE